MSTGDPSRISVCTFAGEPGIIDASVNRSSGGRIHTRGVMIRT